MLGVHDRRSRLQLPAERRPLEGATWSARDRVIRRGRARLQLRLGRASERCVEARKGVPGLSALLALLAPLHASLSPYRRRMVGLPQLLGTHMRIANTSELQGFIVGKGFHRAGVRHVATRPGLFDDRRTPSASANSIAGAMG